MPNTKKVPKLAHNFAKTLNPQLENTYLLRKGKYHGMADLLFDWLEFNCFAYVEW